MPGLARKRHRTGPRDRVLHIPTYARLKEVNQLSGIYQQSPNVLLLLNGEAHFEDDPEIFMVANDRVQLSECPLDLCIVTQDLDPNAVVLSGSLARFVVVLPHFDY
jgi:hypothetical protein